jgi:tetratricopeptide (TPR) repeat protein
VPGFTISPANEAAVIRLCHRLEGIPLAIELAAARVRALSVENIAARLDDRFRLLTGGDQTAALRQQTLRASLDWSYDLLTFEEAVLLRRLSIFAGGWTLEAAEAVAHGEPVRSHDVCDLLSRLVEKSLVDIDAYGERYRLLETVREYAREKLKDAGEMHDVRDRHLDYYVDFAATARSKLTGPDEALWVQRLDQELENLLAAHAHADGERGLRLASSLKHYFVNRGLVGLAHRLAVEALAAAPERSLARCQALFDAGQVGHVLGRYEESRKYLEESLAIAEELENRNRVALTLQPLGAVCLALGDVAAGRRHLQVGLAMALESGKDRDIAAALNALGQLHRLNGDMETAAKLYREAVTYGRRMEDRETVALTLLNLAMASTDAGLDERAAMVLEAIMLGQEVGSRYVGQGALEVCAGIMAISGDWRCCARIYGAVHMQSLKTGFRRDAADEAFLAPLVDNARAELGTEYEAAETLGRLLSYDEAIADARACLARLNG